MDLIPSVSGVCVAAITSNRQAIVVDFLKMEVVAQIALKKDTLTRVSFDKNLDRFILGSWAMGIECLELSTEKSLWHIPYQGYTYAEIIERSNELYVVGLKDDVNECRILNLESGDHIRTLSPCSDMLAKTDFRIGHDSLQEKLLIFDSSWDLVGSAGWKSFALWCFAYDDSGILLVSGPSGYAASFAIGLETPIAEVQPHEYFFRIEDVCWNKKNQCFFGVVSEFEGKPERALLKLDHNLKSFEVLRRFPLRDGGVFCDDRYLITEAGLVFDLDTQSECPPVDWPALLASERID